jgi:hypothetical protein
MNAAAKFAIGCVLFVILAAAAAALLAHFFGVLCHG